MNKFIILLLTYFAIRLNIQIKGRIVKVGVKIKEDWKEKREFIYLKNVEIKKRFVMIMNVKRRSRIVDYLYKPTGS